MEKSTAKSGAMTTAVVTLAVLAVLFAMREAQAIVVPILMAFFLAVVAESPVAWLEKKGLSRVPAILLVVAGIAAVLFAIGILLGTSVQELSERAPEYQQKLRDQIDSLLANTGSPGVGTDVAGILNRISPDASLSLASALLIGVSDLFSKAFLILFMMIFMLLEVPTFVAKLKILGGSKSTWVSIADSVRGYLGIKTLTSLALLANPPVRRTRSTPSPSKAGNRALGQTFFDAFLMSIQAWADYIAEVINRFCVRELVDLNWEVEHYPTFKVKRVQSLALEAIGYLVQTGALKWSEVLENDLRGILRMPKRDSEDEGDEENEEGKENAVSE